ncbi:hypothetical protein PV327_006190 [Microctonus hyperodae]|uniref:HTH CENPB-type domain-containing protein n=1 Tax=Microctonus hyperodae TaxID=165561 RepID=A0AA39F3T5_MICHY|nr:hypothetical protein PV327_006190 [Microctonus hyperodae]
MVRNYKRKGEQQKWSQESMQAAVDTVVEGVMGYFKAATKFGVPQSTLERHVKLRRGNPTLQVKKTLGKYKCVFSEEQENELVDYLKNLEQRNCGLTSKEVRCLAYQLASRNNHDHPFNKEEEIAGNDWFFGFRRRHPELAFRKSDPTTITHTIESDKIITNSFFQLEQRNGNNTGLHEEPSTSQNQYHQSLVQPLKSDNVAQKSSFSLWPPQAFVPNPKIVMRKSRKREKTSVSSGHKTESISTLENKNKKFKKLDDVDINDTGEYEKMLCALLTPETPASDSEAQINEDPSTPQTSRLSSCGTNNSQIRTLTKTLRKHRINFVEQKKLQLLDLAHKTLISDDDDDDDDEDLVAVKQILDYKLKGVDEHQRTIADKLISDVIYYAKLGKLTEDAGIHCTTINAQNVYSPRIQYQSDYSLTQSNHQSYEEFQRSSDVQAIQHI